MKTYRQIATLINAINNCEEIGNPWAEKHRAKLDKIMGGAPSGSGFDAGTTLANLHTLPLQSEGGRYQEAKLAFDTSYHHMNPAGYYDGWTEHRVTVTPSLMFGFELKISGRDRNGIKDYIHEVFDCWLGSDVQD